MLPTYIFGYDIAILNKSFLDVFLPPLANSQTCPKWLDLLDWPPVFEYTSVSSTRILTFSFDDATWSNPPKPIS